jgi:hypothetical protein
MKTEKAASKESLQRLMAEIMLLRHKVEQAERAQLSRLATQLVTEADQHKHNNLSAAIKVRAVGAARTWPS